MISPPMTAWNYWGGSPQWSVTTDEGPVITRLGHVNRMLAKIVTLEEMRIRPASRKHIVSQSAI